MNKSAIEQAAQCDTAESSLCVLHTGCSPHKRMRCKNCGLRCVFNTMRLHGIAIHIGERVGDAPHKRVVRHPSAKILRHLTRQALPFAWHRVAGVLIKLIDATDVEEDCAWQWLCGPACFWSYVFRKFA